MQVVINRDTACQPYRDSAVRREHYWCESNPDGLERVKLDERRDITDAGPNLLTHVATELVTRLQAAALVTGGDSSSIPERCSDSGGADAGDRGQLLVDTLEVATNIAIRTIPPGTCAPVSTSTTNRVSADCACALSA